VLLSAVVPVTAEVPVVVGWLSVMVVIGTAAIGALGAAVGFRYEYAPTPRVEAAMTRTAPPARTARRRCDGRGVFIPPIVRSVAWIHVGDSLDQS
jgi:hypothetical protein